MVTKEHRMQVPLSYLRRVLNRQIWTERGDEDLMSYDPMGKIVTMHAPRSHACYYDIVVTRIQGLLGHLFYYDNTS